MSRQAARSEATRAKLVEAAMELFAAHGYAGVGTEEIVKRARVTRGALYHHFTDKRDLFRAVHEELEARMVAAIATALGERATEDPLEAMRIATGAFLDVATDPGRARITLIEAPSVLGWGEWREIDARYGLGLTEATLRVMIDAGQLPDLPVKPLAHLLLAAMGEAGIMVATAPDPVAARKEVEPALLALLEGLTKPA